MKLFPKSTGLLAAALVLVLPAVVPAAPQLLRGHVPAAVRQLQSIGSLAAETNLNLVIGLPLRNREALTTLLQQLYDPAKPNFHQFLTPEQFADQFGPTAEDYEALIRFAKANGLTPVGTHPNRTLLDVRGSVANIEKALHVKLRVYKHPTESRTFFAPDTEPSLDLNLPVLHVSGLDNYVVPRPMNLKRKPLGAGGGGTPALGSGPGGTYMGNDFRAAYVPGSRLRGTGQSVGLLQFDGYSPSDIAQYESLAGLPSVPLINVYLDGFNGAPGFNNGEVCLDIEMCASMAPRLSSIIVYEAGPFGFANDILNRMATDNLARQLSASWSYSIDAITDQIFQQFAAQGQSFFNASGDFDAWVGPVFPPCDNPYITIVGGTTLSTSGPGGSWVSEKVWNWGPIGIDGIGSGGGISTIYPIPTWQQGIDMTTNGGSTTMRNLPDVALTADNVFIVADGGFFEVVGGTSCATPLFAAFTSLVNQQAAASGDPSVGFLNPAVYAIGKGPASVYTNAFHDITLGDNTWTNSPTNFFAVAGYDLCTGWGTPTGTNLINILAPPSPFPLPNLVVLTNYISGGNGNGIIDPDECNFLDLVLTNIGVGGATTVKVSLSTTTPGVLIAQPNSFFPDLPPNAEGTNFNSYRISTAPTFVCGLPIQLAVLIKSDQVTTTNLLVLPTGVPSIPLRFDNFTYTPIPDVGTTNSVIVISNVDFALSKIAVSMFITHTFDADLVLRLVSPDGTTNVLASNLGSNGQNYGVNCSPDSSRTTFDDSAATAIANGVPPFVGTFRPQQPLSVFAGKSGTNVNGAWRLIISDVAAFDVGALNCWSLLITPSICTDGGGECPGADMALGMTAAPEPAIVGGNLTYTLSVTNFGPSGTKNVSVSQLLPSSVIFVSATSSQGSASQNAGVVTANLGAMPAGTTATISVVVIPTTIGVLTCSASVSSEQPDFNPENNNVTLFSHINPPTADLSVGLSAAPSSLFVGGNVTFSATVTNNGPSAASGVMVTNVIPAGFVLLGETVSQGNVIVYGNVVVCSLGSLASGAAATITINASGVTQGSFTATSVARGNQFDPVNANNSASAVVVVGPAADLGVTLTALPNPVVLFSNMTLIGTVTNAGPSTATNIIFTETLPTGAPLISVTLSPRGTVVTNGNTLTCNLGSIARGAGASITVIVGTTRLGTLTASANVASGITDPNPANNSASISAQISQPFVNIVPAGATLTAESFLPPDGSLEPGETVTIQFRLQNLGNVANTNLTATLAASGGVTSPSGQQSYGILTPIGIPGGVPVSRSFSFTAAGTFGGTVTATLQLQDGTNTLPPATYTFTLPTVATFANTNTITIPDPNAPTAIDEFGPAAPYPSPITVSGLTGQVGKVTAKLYDFTHSYVHDVNVLLVGPTGAKSLLLSHAADVSDVNDVTITFDDSAPSAIAASGTTITSGSWQPSAYAPQPIFSNPAPAGPYTAAMANFSGLNPNGTWSLYVLDDNSGDGGYITNGWSLNFTNLSPVNQVADLGLAVVASPNPILVGSNLTYTFTITNAGPNGATGVTFSNALPAGVTLLSATSSQGNCVINGNVVIGNLASLAMGSSATVTIVVTPTLSAPASVTNTASVAAFETDFHSINNTVSVVSAVNLPLADVALGLTASPTSVIVGSNLTSTITVTNNGPGVAFNVVVTAPIPAAAAYLSGAVSQGSLALSGGAAVASLGDLAPGATATVTVSVAPLSAGPLTNTASVTTASIDLTTGNNSASAVVTVAIPAPIIVAAGAVLLSENLVPNGAIDPGETVSLSLSLANTGVRDTANLGATLQVSGGVTLPNPASNYFGRVVAGGPPVARTFGFTASAAASGSIVATLQLQDGTNDLGTVVFTFGLPANLSFANTNAIIIPDHGPGIPYPAAISLSGLTGVVGNATVTLQGLTHSFVSDVNVLLVSPGGRNVLVMSHTGGFYGVTNLTLTFDDAANTGPLPNSLRLTSGTYQPSHYGSLPSFPPTAPGGPFGSVLANLKGTDPNGAWSLYVLDDRPGDAGVIAGGWSLDLTVIQPVSPIADLAVGMTSTPPSLYTASALQYTINVTNLGPSSAPVVVLTDNLPAGLNLVSITPSFGSSALLGNVLTWNLGTLTSGTNAALTIIAVPEVGGTLLNTVSVTGNVSDSNPANNSAFATTFVSVPAVVKLSGAVGNGQFVLTVTAQAGQAYAVQASTDLTSWANLGIYTAPSNGVFTVQDPLGANTRFYRAIRQVP